MRQYLGHSYIKEWIAVWLKLKLNGLPSFSSVKFIKPESEVPEKLPPKVFIYSLIGKSWLKGINTSANFGGAMPLSLS